MVVTVGPDWWKHSCKGNRLNFTNGCIMRGGWKVREWMFYRAPLCSAVCNYSLPQNKCLSGVFTSDNQEECEQVKYSHFKSLHLVNIVTKAKRHDVFSPVLEKNSSVLIYWWHHVLWCTVTQQQNKWSMIREWRNCRTAEFPQRTAPDVPLSAGSSEIHKRTQTTTANISVEAYINHIE